jgi:hypothetical protein
MKIYVLNPEGKKFVGRMAEIAKSLDSGLFNKDPDDLIESLEKHGSKKFEPIFYLYKFGLNLPKRYITWNIFTAEFGLSFSKPKVLWRKMLPFLKEINKRSEHEESYLLPPYYER